MKNNFAKQKIKYFFKVIADHKTIQKCATKNWRRFLKNSRLIKWQLTGVKVYLRIWYGRDKVNRGKLVNFYNDAECFDKESFDTLLAAFLE